MHRPGVHRGRRARARLELGLAVRATTPAAAHRICPGLLSATGRRTGVQGADERVERAAELIAWAQQGGISTALWETALVPRIQTPASVAASVEHVFVVDPEAIEPLTEKLEGRRPMRLPLAAQTVPDEVPGFGDRSNDVAFAGGWPAGFRGGSKRSRSRSAMSWPTTGSSSSGRSAAGRPTPFPTASRHSSGWVRSAGEERIRHR